MSTTNFGIREQIAAATSEQEITVLLQKSKTFEEASNATRRAWKSTANRTLQKLTQPSEKSDREQVSDKKTVKNKKKQK